MNNKNENLDNFHEELNNRLKVDCSKCFGFCCIALFFSKSEGFPQDKEAGKPCINLQENFSCCVHDKLKEKGLKGCMTYECFGAGQQTAQQTYQGKSWREAGVSAEEMFDVFVQMRNIYEMIWYLSEAYRLEKNNAYKKEIKEIIQETLKLTELAGDKLVKLDLIPYRMKINKTLFKTSEEVRQRYIKIKKGKLKCKRFIAGRPNFIGEDLKNRDLRGENLSSALLIAADLRNMDLSGVDFLGTDLRDADLRGSNLTNTIYLTQFQLNAAKGDKSTKIPPSLKYPSNW